MSEINEKDSFFNLDEDLKTDIALSKDELFSIIDQTNNEDLLKRSSKNKVDFNNVIEENVYMNEDKFSGMIAVFSAKELEEEYKKKSKLKYYINDFNEKKDSFQNKSDRNILLDKFSEAKASNILDKDENILLNDNLELIESDEDENAVQNKNIDSIAENIEKEFIDKNKNLDTNLNLDEIKSVVNYLDELLDALPEEKIEEFVKSDYYKLYKKVIDELKIEKTDY